MKILLDMDGVIVDFISGAARLHNKPYPYDGTYFGWDFNLVWKIPQRDFYRDMGRTFWANLDWCLDGRHIFEYIYRNFDPKDVCILTSPCMTDGCFDGKMDWIRKHLPKEYHRQFLVGSSKEFCANPDHYLIDDRDLNIESFVKAGGKGILVPRPWNANRDVIGLAVPYIQRMLDVFNTPV